MNDVLLDDSLNPRFVHFSAILPHELDSVGRLPKAALTTHVDEALTRWQSSAEAPTVSDIQIEYMEPVLGPQQVRIDVWVEHLDASTCVYGFLCSSENGNFAFARGERTFMRVDAKWSAAFRSHVSTLLKNLPAYA